MKSGHLTDGVLELPFQGSVTISRHCSHQGAQAAMPRAGSQALKVLLALKDRSQTMHELTSSCDLPLTTICARIGFLKGKGLVHAAGMRKGPYGISNTVWSV